MRPLKQAQPANPTPDELLRLLDLQLHHRRNRRGAGAARRRGALLAMALLFLFAVAGVALSALFARLENARPAAARDTAMTAPFPQR